MCDRWKGNLSSPQIYLEASLFANLSRFTQDVGCYQWCRISERVSSLSESHLFYKRHFFMHATYTQEVYNFYKFPPVFVALFLQDLSKYRKQLWNDGFSEGKWNLLTRRIKVIQMEFEPKIWYSSDLFFFFTAKQCYCVNSCFNQLYSQSQLIYSMSCITPANVFGFDFKMLKLCFGRSLFFSAAKELVKLAYFEL